MEWPKVSVIVLNYNGKRHLADCFSSLMELDYPAEKLELLLVDNASVDDSLEFMRERFPSVRIVQNQENLGFAAGNNSGAIAANSDYIAFLNNDTRVDSQWLKELMRPCLEEDNVVCTGSKMLSWDGSAIDFVGGAMNFHSFAFQPYQLMADFEVAQEPILFACGGAMLIQRELFIEVGGFDEDYFLFFEDVDLGWRLWLHGYNVLLAPKSIVYHHLHATTNIVTLFRRLVMFERNALVTVIKNYSDENLQNVLPAALMLASKRAKRLLEAAGWNSSSYQIWDRSDVGPMDTVSRSGLAVLVAVNEVIENLPSILAKRAIVQAERRRTDNEIFPLFRQPLHVNPILQPKLDAEYAWVQSQVMKYFGVQELFQDTPRRILVVSDAMLPINGVQATQGGVRAWSVGKILAAQGHDVLYSMPQTADTQAAALDQQMKDLLWQQGHLQEVIGRATPDIVVICGWSALGNLGMTTIPVILDIHELHSTPLPSQTEEADLDRPEILRLLRRADYITFSNEQQFDDLRSWLQRAGFEDVPAHASIVPAEREAAKSSTASDDGLSSLCKPANTNGLFAFCRSPFKYHNPIPPHVLPQPTASPVAPMVTEPQGADLPSHSSIQHLFKEAMLHWRRGGLRMLIYETLGFLQRRVQV